MEEGATFLRHTALREGGRRKWDRPRRKGPRTTIVFLLLVLPQQGVYSQMKKPLVNLDIIRMCASLSTFVPDKVNELL